ncbi:MAG: hypothetical protein KJI69_05445 [Patescibacteria group bacterium]|nr:hypothetical protein [Patescibacteria group bacterium]
MSIIDNIMRRPSSVPFLLFGVGVFFLALGTLNPVPSEMVNLITLLGVGFFASGILIGFIQALRRRHKL